MKKLQCELCGGIDIVKTDTDLFQCQSCGCKYTLEQVKSIISGVVEITMGETELKRLVKNAETQIELGNDDACSTIDLIIKEYPDRYYGYWLFLKQVFSNIQREKKINLGNRTFRSKYNGDVKTISLIKAKKYYMDLLKITENSTEITKEEIEGFWESNIKRIYDGLINGEIADMCDIMRVEDYQVHPLLINARAEGLMNGDLLKQAKIRLHILPDHRTCEYFPDYNQNYFFKDIIEPYFVLSQRIIGYYITTEDLRDLCLKKNDVFYPIRCNMNRIIQAAKANARRYFFEEKRCPKCSSNLSKTLLGKYACPKCDFSPKLLS